jgi:aquaporin Z
MPDYARRLAAEFLGTFGLLFLGGLAVVNAAGAGQGPLAPGGLAVIAFGFGLALLISLYAFGEVSGGHFNPAVSLAALLDRRIGPVTCAAYLTAQVAGAVAAGLILLSVSSHDQVAATATVPGTGVGAGTALLLETLLTAVFVAVILQVTRSGTMGATGFLAIPFALVAIHLAAVPISGASVNPARTLGSAIVGETYTDIWVYLAGPLLGAVFGWALHRLVTSGRVDLRVPAARRAPTGRRAAAG